jgi:O-antigen/teichoic acid export membrane protein
MTEARAVDVAVGGQVAHRLRHVPNAVSAVVLFCARLLAAVLQLRVVDKHWGGAFTGLNALSNKVLLYVTLLELGLSQSAITLLYEPLLGRNHARVCGMISALRHDVRMLALAGSTIIFPVLALYARFIQGPLPYATVAGSIACVAAAGVVQLMAIHFQSYLNAAEQLDKVNYTFACGYLLKTGIGLVLALHWENYLLLPGATAALTLAEFVALKLSFHRAFPEFCPVPWRQAAREIRRRAKYVLIQKIAGVAYYQSDFIILSITTSLLVVKDYAKFQYVSAALLSVVGLVASSLTTSVARMQMQHEAENRRRQYVVAQTAISTIGAVLMFGFWFTAKNVVSLVFGGSPGGSTGTILLFGIALFLNIVKTVDDVFMMAKGAFHVGWWISIIEVPIYVITGVVLSRSLGFNGILVASITTNLIVAILLKGIVLSGPVFDSRRLQWYSSRFTSMGRALLAAMPLAGAYVLGTRFLHPIPVRFVATNLIALVYLLVAIRWIASRDSVMPGAVGSSA